MANVYFTVGISGCGKTTYCHKFAANDDFILDSDDIRQELWGDAQNQKEPHRVFELMLKRTLEALEKGKNVWYCATNLSMKHRLQFVKNVRAHYPETNLICLVFSASRELCENRNALRARQVPTFVITNQIKHFEMPVENEGWDTIKIVEMENDEERNIYFKKIEKIVDCFGSQKNPHHTYSLMHHSMLCRLRANHYNANPYLLHAAYIHDFGKVFTQTFWEKDNYQYAHYPNHANVSAYIALCAGYDSYVIQIICYHMIPFMDERAQKTWFNRLGEELWNDIEFLHKCDMEAQ